MIILLGVIVVLLIGVALRFAKTIHQLRDYISELERGNANAKHNEIGGAK